MSETRIRGKAEGETPEERVRAWLRAFFGDTHYPQPVLVHALRGYGMVFVSPEMYEEVRRAVPAQVSGVACREEGK